MSNIKSKSPDQRRRRRNRYIEAIEPFRKKFNCTAAEVHGYITNIMSENKTLKEVNAHLDNKLVELQARVNELESTIKAYKTNAEVE